MSRIYVNFYWHMHQPVYKDPLTGKYLMPWVRLHSTKGYYDMVHVLSGFPEIRQTFNLVPSLMAQIEDYVHGKAEDESLILTLKPAGELTVEDKKFILSNFFMANWDTMVKPYPRYWELLAKRGFLEYENDAEGFIESFEERDFRDLQVYFNLVWFGYMAREHFPFLGEMFKKGKDFTEDEKKKVIDTQIEVMKRVIPSYKEFQDKGQIEVTVTPFYHPILPLLMDTDFAKRSLPNVPLPERFSAPEDAKAQIEKSVKYYEDKFGKKPSGMWPSEGSVCPELIPLFNEAGIKWIATDEWILMNSVNISNKGTELYQPYTAVYKGKSVNMIFRDRGLSDLIGFVYAKNRPESSADDLVHNINVIGQYIKAQKNDEPHLVSIILDGENPWEYYPDGGRRFLESLYSKLSNDSGIQCVTVSEFIAKDSSKGKIDKLHTGSWINSNFDIWIGSAEENTGWEYIKRTREFLVDYQEKNAGSVDKKKLQQAWEEIYTAEGSDWFWWYGEDFSTDNDELFDKLFRLHLSNVYKVLDVAVPEYLNIPIVSEEDVEIKDEPIGYIKPVIDGEVTDFYEWQEAGFFDAKKPGGTMHRAEGLLSAIYYGFSKDNLFFRVDPFSKLNAANLKDITVDIHIMKPNEQILSFLVSGSKKPHFVQLTSDDGVNFKEANRFSSIAAKKMIELSIKFKDLKIKKDEEVNFFIQVKKKKLELERYPKKGMISFVTPGNDFESDMWSV